MRTKEELLTEYFKIHGVAAPIAKKHLESDPAIFEWFYSQLKELDTAEKLRREEVKVLMRQNSSLEALVKAQDELYISFVGCVKELDHNDEPAKKRMLAAIEHYNKLKSELPSGI